MNNILTLKINYTSRVNKKLKVKQVSISNVIHNFKKYIIIKEKVLKIALLGTFLGTNVLDLQIELGEKRQNCW